MRYHAEKQVKIVKFICIIFAEELRDCTLSSSLIKISEYRADIHSSAKSLSLDIDKQTYLCSRLIAILHLEMLLLTLK